MLETETRLASFGQVLQHWLFQPVKVENRSYKSTDGNLKDKTTWPQIILHELHLNMLNLASSAHNSIKRCWSIHESDLLGRETWQNADVWEEPELGLFHLFLRLMRLCCWAAVTLELANLVLLLISLGHTKLWFFLHKDCMSRVSPRDSMRESLVVSTTANSHSTKDRPPLGSYAPSSEYWSHYLNSNYLITFKKDNSVSSKLLNLNKRKMGEHDGSLHISEELGKMEQTPGGRTRPEGPHVMVRH